VDAGAKHGQDRHQVLLGGERFTVNDHQFRMILFAKGFKIARAETHKSIPVGNDNAANLSKFYHLHEPCKVFALVVEATATILHLFIDLESVLVAVHL